MLMEMNTAVERKTVGNVLRSGSYYHRSDCAGYESEFGSLYDWKVHAWYVSGSIYVAFQFSG